MSEVLNLYFNQIKDFKLLTHEEEIELGKRIKEGDIDAKKTLIESNLRLVVSIARKYHYSKIPFEDFIAAGNMGLLIATEKWDYTQGYKFSTYATWWIYSYISRYFYDNYFDLNYSTAYVEKYMKIQSYITKCLAEDKNPTYEEISLATGIPFNQVKNIMETNHNCVSIESDESNEDSLNKGNSLEETLIDMNAESLDEEVNYNILSDDIESVLQGLNTKESDILRHRFGFYDGRCYTLDEIGKEYNVTRERIRQIEAKALFKVKSKISNKYTDYYVTSNSVKTLKKK